MDKETQHNGKPLTIKYLRSLGLDIDNIKFIGRSLTFESPIRVRSSHLIGNVDIGAFTYVGQGCELRNCTIGRFGSIAVNVSIGPAEHPVDWLSSHPFMFDGVTYFNESNSWGGFSSSKHRFTGNGKRTIVGNDVWIGRNVVIRQGVTIGDGAIIAAGSFVNKDVPPYAVFAGVPAKLIKFRFSDCMIQRLTAISWWNFMLEPDKNEINFQNVENAVSILEQLIENNSLSVFLPEKYKVDMVNGCSVTIVK